MPSINHLVQQNKTKEGNAPVVVPLIDNQLDEARNVHLVLSMTAVPNKCLVATILQETSIVDVDAGCFFSPQQKVLVTAKGKSFCFLDPNTFHEISNFPTDEPLLFARFVTPSTQDASDSKNPGGSTVDFCNTHGQSTAKRGTILQGMDIVITISCHGSVNMWRMDPTTNCLVKENLLRSQDAGSAPFHCATKTGCNTLFLLDSSGCIRSWSFTNGITAKRGFSDLKYILGTTLMDDDTLAIMSRFPKKGTQICVYSIKESDEFQLIYRGIYDQIITQVIADAFEGLHLIVGLDCMMLVSFSQETRYKLGNGDLTGRQFKMSTCLRKKTGYSSIILAEKNGVLNYVEFGSFGKVGPLSLHLRELGSLTNRPIALLALNATKFFIATRNADAVIVHAAPNEQFKEIGTFENLAAVRDTIVAGVGRDTHLVLASGENDQGTVEAYKKTFRFMASKTIRCPSIRRIFPLRSVQDPRCHSVVAVSSDVETQFLDTADMKFLRIDPLSNRPSVVISNLTWPGCLIQVLSDTILVGNINDNLQLEIVQSEPSRHGTIKHAEVHVKSNTLIYSCGENLITQRWRFLQGTRIPVFSLNENRTLPSEITSLGFLERHDGYVEPVLGLVGCLNSDRLLAIDLNSLETTMSFTLPFHSPTSMIAAQNFFLVSSSDGKIAKIFGYDISKHYSGTVKTIDTGIEQKLFRLNAPGFVAITGSKVPYCVTMRGLGLDYQKLEEPNVIAGSSFVSQTTGLAVIVSNGDVLKVGKLERASERITLGETPISLTFQTQSQTVAVVTKNTNGRYTLHLYDSQSYNLLKKVTFEDGETVLSITSGSFANDGQEYFSYSFTRKKLIGVTILKFNRPTNETVEMWSGYFTETPQKTQFANGYLYVKLSQKIYTIGILNGELIVQKWQTTTGTSTDFAMMGSTPVVIGPSSQIEFLTDSENHVKASTSCTAVASISEDFLTVFDQDKYLQSFSIDMSALDIAQQNVCSRGRYYVGVEIKTLKKDRRLFHSQCLENEQSFYVTYTGAIGTVLQLSSRWSPIFESLEQIAREKALASRMNPTMELTQARRSESTSDFLDGDVVLQMCRTPESIHELLSQIGPLERAKWDPELRPQSQNHLIVEQIGEILEMLNLL